MALSIKDETTDRLVRRYAKLKHTSYTGAIKLAVTEALERESDRKGAEYEAFKARVREIQDSYAALPDTGLTEQDIMGWDENGLPT